jgi:hypothetical protein
MAGWAGKQLPPDDESAAADSVRLHYIAVGLVEEMEIVVHDPSAHSQE